MLRRSLKCQVRCSLHTDRQRYKQLCSWDHANTTEACLRERETDAKLIRTNNIANWETLSMYSLLTLVQVESQGTEKDSLALHVQALCV